MQKRMPTPDLSPIHKLLSEHAVPDDLVVVRLSARAKRLIFKSSVKNVVNQQMWDGSGPERIVVMESQR
jgi:hypothetical protein